MCEGIEWRFTSLNLILGDSELKITDTGACDLWFASLFLGEQSVNSELFPEDPTDWCRGVSLCLGVEWSPFMEGKKLPQLLGPEAEEHTGCCWRGECILLLHSWGLWRVAILPGDGGGTLSGTWQCFIGVSLREDVIWGRDWFRSPTSLTARKKKSAFPKVK